MKDWLDDYYNRYKMSLFQTNVYDKLIQLKSLCMSVKENKSKIILCGNGASSTIASHVSTDFTKQAKIPAICFSDTGPEDIIEHKKTGYLSKYLDYNDLLCGLEYCLENKFSKKYIRNRSINKFDINETCNKYLNIYQNLIFNK